MEKTIKKYSICIYSGKEPACQCSDVRYVSSIPRLGRSSGGGHGNPLQYSCLENPMDRGAWRATVNGVAKSQTRLKRLSICAYICVCKYVCMIESLCYTAEISTTLKITNTSILEKGYYQVAIKWQNGNQQESNTLTLKSRGFGHFCHHHNYQEFY